MGAARDRSIELFGGPAVVRQSTVTIGTSATEIVKGDPDRLRLSLVHFGAADVVVLPGRGVTTTNGYRVAPGNTLQWRVDLDGEEMADRFEGISGAAGQVLFVTELIRLTQGG